MRDLDIRLILNAFLRDRFVLHDPSCILLDEFGLCQGTARVDVAVINGSIHGYEIKSEHDTLQRVDSQLAVYTKTLDYLTFVTNEKHLAHLDASIPAWCGLFVIDKDGILRIERESQKNADIDPHSLVQLLWRDEAIAILRQLGFHKGMHRVKSALWHDIAEAVPVDELNEIVRDTLKTRDATWRTGQPLRVSGGSLLQSATL